MSATESASAGAAAFPALLGTAVALLGPPAGIGLFIWSAVIGGILGGYGGSTFQLLKEIESSRSPRSPTAADWLRLGMRASASAAFGGLISLTVAALAGNYPTVPHILAHPFIVAGISGVLAFLAPIAVPRLQRKAGQVIDGYGSKP